MRRFFCLLLFLPFYHSIGISQEAAEANEENVVTADESARADSNKEPQSSASNSTIELPISPGPDTGIDFSEGVARFQGERIDPTQNRAFRSQFETYLTKDEDGMSELLAYQEQIDLVLDILSPLHMLEDDAQLYEQVEKAYKMLYELAESDVDGGASRTLAHMIFNMWRLRDEIRRDIGNLKQGVRSDGFLYYTNEAQLQSKAVAAQAQFETQIVYFLAQRRFNHAIMASYFYRMLFKGSRQQLPTVGGIISSVERSMEQLGFGSGVSPIGDLTNGLGSQRSSKSSQIYTAEAVEQFCQTVKGKIEEHMESIDRVFDRGEYHSALERLQEVFIPGEYLGPVMTLSLDKRDLFLSLYRKHRKLDEFASAKDYQRVLDVLEEIQAMTDDFIPGAGIQSNAKSAMRMSRFKLVSAKKALSDGEFSKGEALMQESVELWPLNPEIDSFATTVDKKGDAAFQYADRFDEWVQDGDTKRIFENREALGLALAGQEAKLEQLTGIIREYSSSVFIIEQAREMTEHSPLLAWDLIAEVPESFAENLDYLMLRQELLLSAMPYANLLQRAEEAEQAKKWNVAISYYIKAQGLNPLSKIATKGIERADEALLKNPF